ncbi:MAG: hypothetical protein ACYDD1_02250 [Caulobacteraceae bacterium]
MTIPADAKDNRDAGKSFLLTELPATQAEKWATRALLALMRSGVEIPEDVASSGMLGVAAMGLQAFGGLSWLDAEPLMDEMFTCVQIQEAKVTRRPTEDDIEEIGTRVLLRSEVLKLHVGFSLTDALAKYTARLGSLASSTTPT